MGFPSAARVNKVTPVSLGYALSVFNKDSILKQTFTGKRIEGHPESQSGEQALLGGHQSGGALPTLEGTFATGVTYLGS